MTTPAPRPGVLVCGEALIDLLPSPPGDARPVEPVSGTEPYVAFASGGPTNSAIALARLGVPTQLAARISHDPFGRLIRHHLRANEVRLDYAIDAAEQTTLAAVGIGDEGHAEYSFYARGTADWQWTRDELPAVLDPSIAVVHTGSLAIALGPGNAAIEQFVADVADSALISLDPNVRPGLIGDMVAYATDLDRWVALADIVKVSDEDIAAVYPGEDEGDVIARWCAPGRLVAVTRGAGGAELFHAGEAISVSGVAVDVADTVAAGDTFTAGLLDGLLAAAAVSAPNDAGRQEKIDLSLLTTAQVRDAGGRAVAAAAVTCRRPGPNPPYASELG